MKVLLTATVQSHIVQFHKPLIEMLHSHGVEVHVAARDNLAEKNGLKLDFVEKVYDIPFSRSPKDKDNIKAYKELKNILSKEHYDVIHCNTPVGGIVTRLAARKYRRKGTKVFYTAHGFHFYQGAPRKYWMTFYPIEKFFASHYTDKLITINYEDYKLASDRFNCQVYHIHGVGVDSNRYYPVSVEEKNKIKEKLGFDINQKIILNTGELLPNKNQQMAIQAIKEVSLVYPDVLLLIAGNGPKKDDLETLIKELNLEKNVKLLGYQTNLQDYQHVSDVIVACSKREGLPLNIVEAMLSKNPVVVSSNRGHKELIENNKTGFIVEVDDVKEMSNKILTLLSDQKLTEEITSNAYNFIQDYIFKSVKKELEEIYNLGD